MSFGFDEYGKSKTHIFGMFQAPNLHIFQKTSPLIIAHCTLHIAYCSLLIT